MRPTEAQLLAELQAKAQATDHCASCPTLQGIIFGQDPESHQISHNRDFFYHIKEEMGVVYCPWRREGCAAHKVELEFIDNCYQNNWPIPVKEDPRYLHE